MLSTPACQSSEHVSSDITDVTNIAIPATHTVATAAPTSTLPMEIGVAGSNTITATPSSPSQALCQQIKQLGAEEAIDLAVGGIRLYGATSLWQRGSIPSQLNPQGRACALVYVAAVRPWDDAPSDMEWMSSTFYQYLDTPPSTQGHPSITFLVVDERPLYDSFYRIWKCPRDIGAIDINAISQGSGIEGIITFESRSGVSGSFNMATEEWLFTSP
jgi:hypothetical protein